MIGPIGGLAPSRRVIPEGEFWTEYNPLSHKRAGVDDGNVLWDKDDPEDKAVLDAVPRDCVWTVVEGSNGEDWYALPGWHLVNRLGYCITEKPWDDSIESAEYDMENDRGDYDYDEPDDLEEEPDLETLY